MTNAPTFETATESEILAEVARQGERHHVLWQLASDGRDFCGVEFTASERDLEDSPLSVVVEQFVADVDMFIDENGDTPETFPGRDVLEEWYGEQANGIITEAWAR